MSFMTMRFTALTAALAGMLILCVGCGKSGDSKRKAIDSQESTLQACGDYTTPAGKPVQAYVVHINDQAENLLLVVGGTGSVSAVNASTIKIGDKTSGNLRWAGSCGWIVAVDGNAKVIASSIGSKIRSNSWQPEGVGPYKFPMHLLKPFTSGKTLNLPELDGPLEQ